MTNNVVPGPVPHPENPADHARRRRRIWIIAAVVAFVVLVASILVFTWDPRCPFGQRWVDQGDCDACFQGCLAPGEVVKPIIYLYPEMPIDVTVEISHPELITAEYPTYGGGWQVRAEPDGDLVQIGTGRELYALYYEAERLVPAQRTDEGFVVPGVETATFLENTLPQLGLSPHEAEEFIVYWLPILQENPYTYIRFETMAEQNANQALTITPTPDTLIRVMMTWEALDAPVDVTPQVLVAPDRIGFTVVEWGGAEIG